MSSEIWNPDAQHFPTEYVFNEIIYKLIQVI
jgi:hypothetical protein